VHYHPDTGNVSGRVASDDMTIDDLPDPDEEFVPHPSELDAVRYVVEELAETHFIIGRLPVDGTFPWRQTIGMENFPKPPFILATNHLSVLDPPLLLLICPYPIRALVALKHKSNPAFRFVIESLGSIWIKRGEVDRAALRGGLDVLKRGEVLGLAPEGTRASETHALQKGKTGLAYMATRADVPIVPIGLTGTENITANLRRLRRTEVKAYIGEPFRLPESGRVRGEKLEEFTEIVMQRLAAVLPEEYRGVYA
jgi:1-acyl-sn-glycerol-3-phosphate acyltransferase